MAENELKALESKVDQLISLCADLNRENQSLKAAHANWQRERQSLIEKNELASNRVEAMIERLRGIE